MAMKQMSRSLSSNPHEKHRPTAWQVENSNSRISSWDGSREPEPGIAGARYTIPFRSSSSGYLVPRHSIPSYQRVRTMDRSKV